ncbi:MAG: RagB/SusD family nutrient uptake outer membrane protein [Candidatus Cryptobacteroides sp.]
MKININKILIFIVTAILSAGCLEKFPENAVPGKEAVTNVAEAEQAVTGIYAAFKSSALYSGYLTLLPDIQCDMVQAVEGYSNVYGDIWRWDILSTNTQIQSVYGSLYGIIGKCNYFFDMVSQFEGDLQDATEIETLNNLKGEVYCARALCYSELIKCFCKAYEPETADEDLGVVLVTSYYNPERIIRSSLKKSYEFVLEDLDRAYEGISREDYYNNYTFTKDIVNALRARVCLYMQDWEKAIEYSSSVIDKGFQLSSASVATGSSVSAYNYMWQNDAGTEVLWKIGFTVDSYGGALGRVFLNYDYVNYYPDYVPSDEILALYDKNDLRYSSFFAYGQTGYNHHLACPFLVKYKGNPTFTNIGILHVQMPKVFRLSEQYLIRAEAYCREGKYSLAADDLTVLRKARYSTYGSASVNASTWEQTILDERAKELFMEGFRLHDLKRFHRGFERKAQQNTVKAANSLKIEKDDPRFVWPIPQHELDAPGSEIQPNESNR